MAPSLVLSPRSMDFRSDPSNWTLDAVWLFVSCRQRSNRDLKFDSLGEMSAPLVQPSGLVTECSISLNSLAVLSSVCLVVCCCWLMSSLHRLPFWMKHEVDLVGRGNKVKKFSGELDRLSSFP